MDITIIKRYFSTQPCVCCVCVCVSVLCVGVCVCMCACVRPPKKKLQTNRMRETSVRINKSKRTGKHSGYVWWASSKQKIKERFSFVHIKVDNLFLFSIALWVRSNVAKTIIFMLWNITLHRATISFGRMTLRWNENAFGTAHFIVYLCFSTFINIF